MRAPFAGFWPVQPFAAAGGAYFVIWRRGCGIRAHERSTVALESELDDAGILAVAFRFKAGCDQPTPPTRRLLPALTITCELWKNQLEK